MRSIVLASPRSRWLLALAVLLTSSFAIHAWDVTGIITDDTGQPIEAARMTLFNADTTFFREVRSAADGRFRVEGVPAGIYTVGAAAPGRAYEEQAVTMTAGGATTDFVLGPDVHPGRWDVLGDPGERLGGTDSGVLLPDGRIIYCHDTQDPVLFDPATGVRTRPPASPSIQGCHAVTLLPDGRVIYVGGADWPVYGPGTKQVKTFDPVTQTWAWQPGLTDDRWYPTMVPLSDGGLLAVGGGGLRNPKRVTTSEIFDPATRTWTPAGEIALGNEVSPAVLLYTGEVLMTHRPPQRFNPATRTWRKAADFVQGSRMPNGDHSDHEIVLMPNGEVVAIGHKSLSGTLVEIYDPAADAWRLGTNRVPARSRASILLLPDRQILVLGGEKEDPADTTRTNPWGQLWLTEAYDPAAGTWRRLADLHVAREYHALPILVPDGRVLVVGGEEEPGREPTRSVIEAFSPPYLFRGIRPRLAPLDSACYHRGERLTLRVDRTAAPTEVILMGTTATTHFMDSGNGRYLSLPFTQ